MLRGLLFVMILGLAACNPDRALLDQDLPPPRGVLALVPIGPEYLILYEAGGASVEEITTYARAYCAGEGGRYKEVDAYALNYNAPIPQAERAAFVCT